MASAASCMRICPSPTSGNQARGRDWYQGMTFTIEPIKYEGTYRVILLPDGWTVTTADGKLSVQFEHTIAITRNGPDILTRL